MMVRMVRHKHTSNPPKGCLITSGVVLLVMQYFKTACIAMSINNTVIMIIYTVRIQQLCVSIPPLTKNI